MEANGTCVLIGAGMCGLLTAAAVAPYFHSVVVLEKDNVPKVLPEDNIQLDDKRSGVLQWQHPHGVTPGGLVTIEKLLPGFKTCCKGQGAHVLGEDMPINDTMWQSWLGGKRMAAGTFEHPAFVISVASRPLFERCARHLLLEQHLNVQLRTGTKATSLQWKDDGLAVTGVCLKGGEQIQADFVIETSGGNCQAVVDAVESKGCGECQSTLIDPGLNYYTRFFRVPEQERKQSPEDTCFVAYHMPTPPDVSGHMFLRVEGDVYQANLAMLNKLKVGPEVADFLEWFKTPHAPDAMFYETLKDAEPVGPMISWLGYPGTSRRRFELMNMPEGYLILGDALANLNPRFGTGMTVAACQADMLGELLSDKSRTKREASSVLSKQDMQGLSMQAQKKAAGIVDFAHGMVAGGDLQFAFTKGHRSRNPFKQLLDKYTEWSMQMMCFDLQVSQTVMLVTAFSLPPTALFQPSVMWKVLGYGAQSTWNKMSQLTCACTAVALLLLAVGAAHAPASLGLTGKF